MYMKKKGDSILLLAIMGLALFGLVMISSVSVFESNNLTFEIEAERVLTQKFEEGDQTFSSTAEIRRLNENTVKQYLTTEELKEVTAKASNSYYLWQHLKHMVVALIFFAIFATIPYQVWRKFAPIFFAIAVISLLAVLVIGVELGGAKSWIVIAGQSFQPSEFAKLALILYLASWLDKREKEVATMEGGFGPFLVIMGFVAMLLALQPDYGSLLVVTLIATSIYFVAGASISHLALGGMMGIFGMVMVVFLKPHVWARFMVFLNPSENDTLGAGYQLLNSLVAIGSGGFFGLGFSKSVQKFGYLPEVQSDSIISAIGEEMGFLKTMIFFGAFVLVAYRGYLIAEKSTDRFAKLVATGITTWIIFQAIINIAVNTGLFPVTGITLPFISYGGTSLFTLMIGAGILYNISKGNQNLSNLSNENFGVRRGVGRTRKSRARRRVTIR